MSVHILSHTGKDSGKVIYTSQVVYCVYAVYMAFRRNRSDILDLFATHLMLRYMSADRFFSSIFFSTKELITNEATS